jgi:hypothetical protein
MQKLHVGGASRPRKSGTALHQLVTAFGVKKALTVGGTGDVRETNAQPVIHSHPPPADAPRTHLVKMLNLGRITIARRSPWENSGGILWKKHFCRRLAGFERSYVDRFVRICWY